jgi:predicted nucleic acid-binding protein
MLFGRLDAMFETLVQRQKNETTDRGDSHSSIRRREFDCQCCAVDVPAAAAAICARAYTRYLVARKKSGRSKAPSVPLPDFFIGAHAELMGWELATRDVERYRVYFPAVGLIAPAAFS